jgi:hypothetical protein
MNELEFNLEMQIPKLNGEIYYAIYEVENWLRRICLASFMIKYGRNWASKIPNKVSSVILHRIEKNKDLFYLGAETDDNLIWMSMHGELRKLLFDVNVWPVVKQLTGYNKDRFTAKLIELNDIRNVLAHNRALSKSTNTIFQGLVTSLQAGIDNFKRIILYTNSNILEEEIDSVNDFFQQCMRGNDWGTFQAFLARSIFFTSLFVFL